MPKNKQQGEKHWYNKRTCFRSCHLRFDMTDRKRLERV